MGTRVRTSTRFAISHLRAGLGRTAAPLLLGGFALTLATARCGGNGDPAKGGEAGGFQSASGSSSSSSAELSSSTGLRSSVGTSGSSAAQTTSSRTSATSSSSSSSASSSSKSSSSGTASSSSSSSSSSASSNSGTSIGYIQNDVFWKDTAGTPIYSQGGGVLQVGKTFYWYGARYGGAATYAASPTGKNSDTSFVAVTCYSSTDLVNWKFEGNAVTQASIGATGWVGRIGATYHSGTNKYVLVMQYVGTNGSGELFATSSTPNGPFTFANVQATITNVVNNNSGDQAVFTDDDGQAYLVFSNANGRSHLYVAPLRKSDFLAVEPATTVFNATAGREGNCMFKYGGRYYLNSSDLHGWNASHTYFISATNILGPYSAEAVIGGTDADFSHVSQSGLFLSVKGSSGTVVIFGGDRWSDFAGNGIGFNQWNPLSFSGTTPTLNSLTQWSIDTTTGTWAVGPANNYALNPSFEADRVSVTQPAGWTTTNSANASKGHTGNWRWTFTAGSGTLKQALSGLPNGTYTLAAWVRSSGGQSTAELYATCAGTTKTAPVNTAIAAWKQVTVPGIAVSGGSCEIGARTTATTGQSLDVDDFTFIKN